jgi:proteic killer suppression protein
LEITFNTRELRNICEDESLATQTLGSDTAKALKNRLADIRAADIISDVLAGQPSLDKNTDCYHFELANGHKLIVKPSHVTERTNTDGTTDWKRVHRVQVISLMEPQNDL